MMVCVRDKLTVRLSTLVLTRNLRFAVFFLGRCGEMRITRVNLSLGSKVTRISIERLYFL